MMPIRILAAVALGFSAGACSFTSTTTESAPPPPPVASTTTTVYSNTASSEQVCVGYGLRPGTAAFSRCVAQDMEARARGLPPAPPAPTASTTVYPSPSRVTVTPGATTPPAGVEAFRDEYGYRYDGQGNRLDRYGNIISPQSKIP